MTLARTHTGVLLGTSESSGVTIANNATTTGSEVDVLGDDVSVGDMWLYAVFTGAGTTGTLDIKVNSIRTTGQVYSKVTFEISIAPISGTQKIPLGKRPVSRFMNCEAKNNGTGGNLTNVAILYELEKFS
jgi:hypothetical protein